MKLWSIQPIEVYNIIEKEGTYRTNENKIDMPEFLNAYAWLSEYLSIKDIAPNGVTVPVWAWYRFDGKEKKPDLRYNCYGYRGERYACMELDIPSEKVLLSDFELWHFVLNNWWFDAAYSEEDSDIRHNWYSTLSQEKQEWLKRKSWEQIFGIEYFDNDWIRRGYSIQAVFWELKKEYIKKVQFFTAR